VVIATMAIASLLLVNQWVRAQDIASTSEPDQAPANADRNGEGASEGEGGSTTMVLSIDGGVPPAPFTTSPDSQRAPADHGVDAGTAATDLAGTPTGDVARAMAIPSMAPELADKGRPMVAVEADTGTTQPASVSHYGLTADIGVSGPLLDAGLLLTLRPIRWIQVQAGSGYNGFAFGVRGGATLVNPLFVPFSLTCEGGHYFEGDANKVVHWFSSDAQEIASLRKFSYDYFNLLGGLELGSQRFSIYLRGGVTWMHTTIKEFEQSVRDVTQVDLRSSDPKVSYRGPTFKVGAQYFF